MPRTPPPSASIPFQIYRHSSIGSALSEALDELQYQHLLTPQLAEKVALRFDAAMAKVLAERVSTNLTFKGHLHTYRFLDDVWYFDVENVTVKFKDPMVVVNTKKIKIIAHNAHPQA